ncbi:MAG: hypothetical protein ACSHXB_19340 [Sulfitobacter sp.]
MVQLGEHFASEGRGRESEWARQRKWFIKARQDHQRREELADKVDDTATALSAAVAIASDVQITEFKVKLDTYDSATVTALMENQELLDAVRERLDTMLSRAHVLGDGRRVFKTEDGTQVFDEHGAEVAQDEVDPMMISDERPTWEAYSEGVELEATLTAERTNILEFQAQVDAARERVDDGEISEADLAELDADLLEAMPDAVRSHAGIELNKAALAPHTSTERSVAKVSAPAQNLGDASPAFTPM